MWGGGTSLFNDDFNNVEATYPGTADRLARSIMYQPVCLGRMPLHCSYYNKKVG